MKHYSTDNQYRYVRTGLILDNLLLFVMILARLLLIHCRFMTSDLDRNLNRE